VPPTNILPETPTPPETLNAPVALLVDDVVLAIITVATLLVVITGPIFATALLMASCATRKNTLSAKELSKWSSKNDTLYYNGIASAAFTGYEVELYKGDMTRELCLEQINDTIIEIDSILLYVHTIHRNDKVQVISTYNKYRNK
jgi:hypothetical protein